MSADHPPVRTHLLRNVEIMMTEHESPEIYLKHRGGVDALRGQDARTVIESILPLVDGYATPAEIVDAASRTGTVTAEQAERMLHWLIETGMCVADQVAPGDAALRSHYHTQVQYFSAYGADPTARQKRLQTGCVAVIGLEYVGSVLVQHLAAAGIGHLRSIGNPQILPAEVACLGRIPRTRRGAARHTYLAQHIRALGLGTQYEGIALPPGAALDWSALLTGCDLAVCIVPRWLSALLRGFNQAALDQQIPCLALWFEESTRAYLGPLVVPHETACLECLEVRQRSRWGSADMRAIVQQHAETQGPAWDTGGWLLPWVHAVAAMAACEIVTALAQERRPATYGHLLCIDVQDWQMQRSLVWKLPRCPACSRTRHTPAPQPFALRLQRDQAHGATPPQF